MDMAKAIQIVPILMQQGFIPQIIQNPDNSLTIAVQHKDGIEANVLKTFADNQQLSVKSRVVVIT